MPNVLVQTPYLALAFFLAFPLPFDIRVRILRKQAQDASKSFTQSSTPLFKRDVKEALKIEQRTAARSTSVTDTEPAGTDSLALQILLQQVQLFCLIAEAHAFAHFLDCTWASLDSARPSDSWAELDSPVLHC